jgi:glycosyltransferase involved in cell wall biosynthesis
VCISDNYNIAILIGGLAVDGVTLEAYKKKKALEDLGHRVQIITGNRNKHPARNGRKRRKEIIENGSIKFLSDTQGVFEDLAFPHLASTAWNSRNPELRKLTAPFQEDVLEGEFQDSVSKNAISRTLDTGIRKAGVKVESELTDILNRENIDILIPENTLAMPMQLPSAIAVGNIIRKHNFPTIESHHDFYWERPRFKDTLIEEILLNYFPVNHNSARHLVINDAAKQALLSPHEIDFTPRPRESIDSLVLPNVFYYDFDPDEVHPANMGNENGFPAFSRKDKYNQDFRRELGFRENDIIFLQNTRIIERKGIERSVDLIKKLKEARPKDAKKMKLVMSLNNRDEGEHYPDSLYRYIKKQGLSIGYVTLKDQKDGDVIFIYDRVNSIRRSENGKKIYHYYDTYPNADFVLYPSEYEGWGNVVGEAVQAKKPLMINKYDIYTRDIKPLGFDFVEIDGEITDETVKEVLGVLDHAKAYKEKMVEHNFDVAKRNIGFDKITEVFETLFEDENFKRHIAKRVDFLEYKDSNRKIY